MNLFRKRYTPSNREELLKSQSDIKIIESAMRGIGKALENYHPHYQAIEQLNKGLSNDLNKFYERYPQFKEIGDQLTGTFKVQNEYLTHIMQKLVSIKGQFTSWFMNFDVMKELWKKYDTSEQNFLHYSEKIVKLKEKAGSKLSQKDQDQIIGNEKKFAEAKSIYEAVNTELGQLSDKILYLSYTVVNSSLLEFLDTKSRYYEEICQEYRAYDNLSSRLNQMERTYLASFEDPSESPENVKASGSTFRSQMLKVRQNMITGASGEKTDLFHELEEKNRLEDIFLEYQNNYSTEASLT